MSPHAQSVLSGRHSSDLPLFECSTRFFLKLEPKSESPPPVSLLSLSGEVLLESSFFAAALSSFALLLVSVWLTLTEPPFVERNEDPRAPVLGVNVLQSNSDASITFSLRPDLLKPRFVAHKPRVVSATLVRQKASLKRACDVLYESAFATPLIEEQRVDAEIASLQQSLEETE